MTATTQQIEKAASREATDWFVLLSDDPDDAQLQGAFQAWYDQSAVNAQAWQAMVQASQSISTAKPVLADKWTPLLEAVRGTARVDSTRTLKNPFKHKQAAVMTGRPSRPFRKTGLLRPGGFRRLATFATAGLAVAACLVAVLAAPDWVRGLQSDYVTGTGQTRQITLDDGSTVTLAPESAIAVAYSAGQRTVRLLDGEAFFEVSPNPERPFRVEAEGVDTTVLGTGFDVQRNGVGVRVSVAHGRVRVDYTGEGVLPVTETLRAGQSLRVDWSGAYQVVESPANHVAAWRKNQIVARYEPFGSVVDQLRRYYSGKIVVLDDELSSKPVTGVYNLADPLEALYGIARAQNAVLWQISPWLVFVSKG
ncbi:FecR domain-containing protein [Thalassospira sp. TSL5-1]|uniref:FecR family protein n=1 Tax=Thalassospira sp. TSL5-1 TaxID=1544451 RepID=UPI00093C8123|nr:FecR domain-containing protein [Thalassospira sp. TSL5-1]